MPTTQIGKTDTKHHTLEPVYEERFKMAWTHKDLMRSLSRAHRAKIVLKIWDHDTLSGPDNMGECTVPLPLPGEPDTIRKQWVSVDPDSARHAKGRMQVSVRVEYTMREEEDY